MAVMTYGIIGLGGFAEIDLRFRGLRDLAAHSLCGLDVSAVQFQYSSRNRESDS